MQFEALGEECTVTLDMDECEALLRICQAAMMHERLKEARP